ncbi:biotrophy-associated secreted protein 2 [Colletotrichum orchidophilum]|uniref:Biotrophy-associated secreted protein 2 n=1 Tax=Colletotrichum orchidophilum TaxID=1209926 RepID=A0A1G4BF49_9PEZI|nr:biotrophy-associated secreted protein 2 [Colletotrichum orchidophilum]OHE99993.1 biotrophy-associated secreted protein 2 [Colletotrichum orchidophilum]
MVRITLFATLAFAMTAFAITPNNAGAKNVGQGNGAQFITGGCVDDADCSSKCCANASGVGVCSAEAAQFQNGKNGCNFVDPNKAATIAAAKAQVAKQGF